MGLLIVYAAIENSENLVFKAQEWQYRVRYPNFYYGKKFTFISRQFF
jgi:hypothetical protein